MASPFSENAGDAVVEPLASDTKSAVSFQPFTKAERVKQLNDIDKSITKLLHSAGLAIKTLTMHQTDSTSVEESPQSFIDAANTYLEDLHSVDVRLKRQIYGLHEAGIISTAKESPSRLGGENLDTSRSGRDNMALDVGWLNSRSGKVRRDMEAELWAKARTFLEALEAQNKSGRPQRDSEKDIEDQDIGN